MVTMANYGYNIITYPNKQRTMQFALARVSLIVMRHSRVAFATTHHMIGKQQQSLEHLERKDEKPYGCSPR